jgi:hypothetical protein
LCGAGIAYAVVLHFRVCQALSRIGDRLNFGFSSRSAGRVLSDSSNVAVLPFYVESAFLPLQRAGFHVPRSCSWYLYQPALTQLLTCQTVGPSAIIISLDWALLCLNLSLYVEITLTALVYLLHLQR